MFGTTPTEDIISPEESAKIYAAQSRRKSSSWKGFKRQLSKVDMKLKKTFGEGRKGSIFYAPTDGTPLSPVEISPDTVSSSTPTDTDKSDYMEDLDKDDLEMSDDSDTNTNTNSDQESEPRSLSQSQSNSNQNIAEQSCPRNIPDFPPRIDGRKARTMSQPAFPAQSLKKVDFNEEIMIKTSFSTVDGGRLSRPSDLPLQDNSDRPNPPPRTKRKDNRNQRLLSVPNIKYVRQDAAGMQDLRSRSNKDQASFAGNIMRRFSKYQLCEEKKC